MLFLKSIFPWSGSKAASTKNEAKFENLLQQSIILPGKGPMKFKSKGEVDRKVCKVSSEAISNAPKAPQAEALKVSVKGPVQIQSKTEKKVAQATHFPAPKAFLPMNGSVVLPAKGPIRFKERAIEVKNTAQKSVKEAFVEIKGKVTGSYPGKDIYSILLQNRDEGFEKTEPKDIRSAIAYCVLAARAGKVSEKEKEDFRAFFAKLGELPADKFNRTLLLGGQEKLQRILSSELDQLLSAQEVNPRLKEDKDHQLELAMAQARLAISLGTGFERAGGCNGAVIVKSLEGKAIGVFKAPPDRSWDVVGNLKGFFGQARLFNRRDKMNEPYSEVAMYYFSEIFGFDLAPAAKITELKNEQGAFLAFLGGYQELADVREELEKRDSFTKDELVKWQLATVAIFASLNFDPHDGNIFVRMEKSPQGGRKIANIKIIDGGNDFAQYLPGEWAAKGHRREPGDLKISKQAFEAEVLEFIRTRLTDENYDKFVRKISAEKPGFWTAEMDLLHRRTFQVLRDGVLTGKVSNPYELLNLLTDIDYNRIIEERPLSKENLNDNIIMDIGQEEVDMMRSFLVVDGYSHSNGNLNNNVVMGAGREGNNMMESFLIVE